LFAQQLPCQIGGGIRSVEAARHTLSLGARRLIVGSSLIRKGAINTNFARQLAAEFGPERLVFALDARGGKVAIRGWKEITAISPLEMMRELEPCCGAFLYTHIDTEGMMTGLPLEPVLQLRDATEKQLIVAGGITSQEEIDRLHALGVDAVVGMALYLGRLKLPDNIALSK